MRETTIRLPEDMIDALDAEADGQGISRSAYIRSVLKQRSAVDPTTAESLREEIEDLKDYVGYEEGG